MRKPAAFLVVVTASVVAAGSATGVHPNGARTMVGGGITIRVPAGWHVRRGWLSDVSDPVPRLAVASFPVRLSRHTCECGMPKVRGFPRAGAFLFMWEDLTFPRRALAGVPRRPTRFSITSERPQRYLCGGPSDEIVFQDAGRVFQAEIYLGSAAGPTVRAQLIAIMNSLRVPRPGALPGQRMAAFPTGRDLLAMRAGRHRRASASGRPRDRSHELS